ncbi:hypothetical protein FNF29_06864 [Cafeteria roenbergensis]|uniref:Peptidase M3A/M3B catalytic domain-containing protein n=1 Tax=Cafeteria roenbergensis TaxID=33653 RepID=A0A5A8C5V4_CAFRO|nr:hypothetical protein FNF29_06864 [Cafeteria roenbergensis]|eukprot:KAA0148205.1 hypothetical protein FNF29_06864 [Cafeteria roenbergensis]
MALGRQPAPISADQDLTATYLRSFCDEETAAVQVLLAGASSLTREPLLWAANQMDSRLADVLMLGELLREVHPEKSVREAASYCVQAAAANATAVSLNRPLFDAFHSLSKGQRRALRASAVPPIDPSARGRDVVVSHDAVRYVRKTLEAFARSGVGIVPEEQEAAFFARIRELQDRITALSQQYDTALAEDRRGVWLLVPGAAASNATPPAAAASAPGPPSLAPKDALPLSGTVSVEGLPADFVAARLRSVPAASLAEAVAAHTGLTDSAPAAGDSKEAPAVVPLPGPLAAVPPSGAPPVTVLEISTDYPDAGPATKYAIDRRLRAAVSLQSARRGFPQNQATLASLLAARAELSRTIAEAKAKAGAVAPGRAGGSLDADQCSPAGLSLQSMMAKEPAAVRTLLDRVLAIARGPGERERLALERMLRQDPAQQTPPGEANPALPDGLRSFDLGILMERVRRSAFNVSSDRTRAFFTYALARRGVITTAARLFGLRFAVVAAPSLGAPDDTGIGGKARDRALDACLNPDFAKSLTVCERPVITPLDESAVAVEASAVPDAHRWHPSVEVIDVYTVADGSDETEDDDGQEPFSSAPAHTANRGAYIGRLYLDAFPRKDKYKHMAMFPVRPGLMRWQEPSEEGRRRRQLRAAAEEQQGGAAGAAAAARRGLASSRTTSRVGASALARAMSRRSRVGSGGDGSEVVLEQHPEAALVCNFEPEGPMEHSDVVTLFHEFGHALHHLLGGRHQRFTAFSGASTETDFVEVPSQLNEAFAWDAAVLASFAARKRTDEEMLAEGAGAPQVEVIPGDLVDRMRAADAAGRALGAWRQAYLSALSLRLHAGEFAFSPDAEPKAAPANAARRMVSPTDGKAGQQSLEPSGDGGGPPSGPPSGQSTCPPLPETKTPLDAAVNLIADETSPLPPMPGSHLASNFAHLVGYGSNYYSYTWSDVIVKDMLGPFEAAKAASASAEAQPANATGAESPADGQQGKDVDPDAGSLLSARNAAHRYRRDVLEVAGRLDGDEMVSAFLGRDFEYGAYEAWLGEGMGAAWLGEPGQDASAPGEAAAPEAADKTPAS